MKNCPSCGTPIPTKSETILEVLSRHGEMTVKSLIVACDLNGVSMSYKTAHRLVEELLKSGKVEKVKTGVYKHV